MKEPTMAFLKTQFKKYYQNLMENNELHYPVNAEQREWGWIPFSVSSDTTMYRHESILDYDSLGDYLVQNGPCHIYHSVAMYEAPSERSMREKGWLGADLIFDLDADHLEHYDPDAEYSEMLEEIKTELLKLIDILENDLGFDDMMITFSGNRGYHVHIHDEDVRSLGKNSRRQIVDYIRGIGFEMDSILIESETGKGVSGNKNSKTIHSIDQSGGWGKRVHDSFQRYLDEFMLNDDISTEEKVEELTKYDGVSEKRAKAAVNSFKASSNALRQGRLSPHPAGKPVMKEYANMVVEDQSAHIDEPVTTDINRLIRLPKSLHGGSGLQVTPIGSSKEDVEQFDPLTDAVPSFFDDGQVTVKYTDDTTVTLNEKTVEIETGKVEEISKDIAIFMMVRGMAEYIDHNDQ